MRPSDNAIKTALRFWQDAREDGTEHAWHECWLALDAIVYLHCDESMSATDREYFIELRNATRDAQAICREHRTGFQKWLKNHHDVAFDNFMAEHKDEIIASAEDDTEQGININKWLYKRFMDWLAKRPKKPAPDTEQTAQIRALNEENRRAHG